MKKGTTILVLSLLIFVIAFSLFAKAQTLEETQQGLQKTSELVTNEQARSDFLKEQWANILGKTAVGKFFVASTPIIKNLDPLFKIVPGVEFSWSEIFFLAATIALSAFIFLSRILTIYIKNKKLKYPIAILTIFIVGWTGAIRWASDKVTAFIDKIDNIWIRILVFVLLVVLLLYFSIFTKLIKKQAEKAGEKKEIEKLKKEVSRVEVEERREERYEEKKTPEEEIGKKLLEEIGRTAEETEELETIRPVKKPQKIL